jgi:hypothetical protein
LSGFRQRPNSKPAPAINLRIGVLRSNRHIDAEVLAQPDTQTGERRNVTTGAEGFDPDSGHDCALVAGANTVTSSSPYPTTS